MQVWQVYFNLQQTVNPAVCRWKTAAGCRISAETTVIIWSAIRVPNSRNLSDFGDLRGLFPGAECVSGALEEGFEIAHQAEAAGSEMVHSRNFSLGPHIDGHDAMGANFFLWRASVAGGFEGNAEVDGLSRGGFAPVSEEAGCAESDLHFAFFLIDDDAAMFGDEGAQFHGRDFERRADFNSVTEMKYAIGF